MNTTKTKAQQRKHRHARIRSRVHGTAQKPRLAVFKSNRYIYAQLINDDQGVTLVSADSRSQTGGSPSERATGVGRAIAIAATKASFTTAVFDRGGFRYFGLVKLVAEGAREAGLNV